MVTGVDNAASAAFAQMQKQQALRQAEQADRRADTLKTEAETARKEAREADDRARGLESDASVAQTEATRRRLDVNSAERFSELGEQIPERLLQAVQGREDAGSPAVADTAPEPSTVSLPVTTPSAGSNQPSMNLLGQMTGSTVSVFA